MRSSMRRMRSILRYARSSRSVAGCSVAVAARSGKATLLGMSLLHALDVEVHGIGQRLANPTGVERRLEIEHGAFHAPLGLKAQLLFDLLRRHVIRTRVVGRNDLDWNVGA